MTTTINLDESNVRVLLAVGLSARDVARQTEQPIREVRRVARILRREAASPLPFVGVERVAHNIARQAWGFD